VHTGHFYFAKNRTFLLCVDNGPDHRLHLEPIYAIDSAT
jgi:hypothetical protein